MEPFLFPVVAEMVKIVEERSITVPLVLDRIQERGQVECLLDVVVEEMELDTVV